MTPTTRTRICATCHCKVEHDLTSGVIVTTFPQPFNPELEAPCKQCDDWLAGRPTARAKRPGES